jgi:predicted sulfurtransferase
MKHLIRIFLVAAAALALLSIAACTDAAKPVNITKVSTPTPQNVQPGTDSHGHAEGEDSPRISLADAKKAFDNGSAIFIDTHPKAAYDADHIKGAINLTVQDFEAKYNTIPKGKKIIAYCS